MVMNTPPIGADVDITLRYRMGYDAFRNKGMDVIFLIENDDWYAPDYIEQMYKAWELHNKPDILGQQSTLYYHLNLRRYFYFHHMDRSSAMNSMLKPDLNFEWCKDNDPYTDMHLWTTLKGVTWAPPRIICIGMKHGIGKCGGYMHVSRLHRFTEQDNGLLAATVDAASFEFYNAFPHREYEQKPNMQTMFNR